MPSSAGDPQVLLASLSHDAWDSKQTPDLFHVVQRGETLSSIAPRYGARVSDLVAINSLSSAARIKEGQKLILPGGVSKSSAEPVVDQGIYPDAVVEAQRVAAAKAAPKAAPAPTVASTVAPSAAFNGRAAKPQAELAVNIPSAVAEVAADDAAAEAGDTIGMTDTIEQAAAAEQEVATALPAVPPPCKPRKWSRSNSGKLLADPSDYSVAEDRTIRVQEDETIGHYADWLGVKASDLRRMNGMKGTSAVRVGKSPEARFLQSDAGAVRRRAARVSPGSAGTVLRKPSHRRHERARREARRIDLGACRSQVQHPGLVAASVQPRPRPVDGQTVDPSRHSGSGEPRERDRPARGAGILADPHRRIWRLAVARGAAVAASCWLVGGGVQSVLVRIPALERRRRDGVATGDGGYYRRTGTNVRVSYRICASLSSARSKRSMSTN